MVKELEEFTPDEWRDIAVALELSRLMAVRNNEPTYASKFKKLYKKAVSNSARSYVPRIHMDKALKAFDVE